MPGRSIQRKLRSTRRTTSPWPTFCITRNASTDMLVFVIHSGVLDTQDAKMSFKRETLRGIEWSLRACEQCVYYCEREP